MPTATPVSRPVEEPMAAIVSGLLLHRPPPNVFVSVVLVPGHTWLEPAIGPGLGLTVNVAIVLHPLAK